MITTEKKLILQNLSDAQNILMNLDEAEINLKEFDKMDQLVKDLRDLVRPLQQFNSIEQVKEEQKENITHQNIKQAQLLFQQSEQAEDKIFNEFDKMTKLYKDLKNNIIQDTNDRQEIKEIEEQKQQDSQIVSKVIIKPLAKVKQSRFKDHLFIQQTFNITQKLPEKELNSIQQFESKNELLQSLNLDLSEILEQNLNQNEEQNLNQNEEQKNLQIQDKIDKSQTKIVYVAQSRDATKYHKYDCKYLYKSKIEKSFNEAVTQGYQACKQCYNKSEQKDQDEMVKQYLQKLKEQ